MRAASSEDTRPVLTGVLMAAEAEGIRLVATDSYRLAVKDLPGAKGVLSEGQKVLVPVACAERAATAARYVAPTPSSCTWVRTMPSLRSAK